MDRPTFVRYVSCLILVFLLSGTDSFAGWDDVRPWIRGIFPRNGERPLQNVTIVFDSEASEWPSNELRTQLEQLGAEVIYFGVLPPNGRPIPLGVNGSVVRIGLWDSMHSIFEQSGRVEFQVHPPQDGYYVIVNPNSASISITASSVRGLNYAVTSFWQAADVVGQDIRISGADIVDCPYFAKRWIANFHRLGQHGDYCRGGGRSYADNLADSLLKTARDVMLYQKANGLVHDGETEEYSDQATWSDGDNDADEAGVRDVLDRLAAGRDDGSIWHDRWQDFRFDWYEGSSWEKSDDRPNPDEHNHDKLYRRIQVKTSFTVGANVGGLRTLNVIPKKAGHFFSHVEIDPDNHEWGNGDFYNQTGTPQQPNWPGWNLAGNPWTASANDNPQISIAAGGSRWIEAHNQSIYLDPALDDEEPGGPVMEYGPPARQMVLEFRLITDGANVQPRILLQLKHQRRRWDEPGPQDGTMSFLPDPDDPNEGDPSAPTLFEVIPTDAQSPTTGAGSFVYKILFLTYGATHVYPRFTFKNVGASQRNIEIDDFKIYDADVYDVYADGLGVPGQNPDWGAQAFWYHPGQGPVDVSGSIQFAELEPEDDHPEPWRIHHARVTLPDAIFDPPPGPNDSVVVTYWVGTKLPVELVVGNPDHLPRYPFEDKTGRGRKELRTDSPALFTGIMNDQMSWFENEFTQRELGPCLSGFHIIENEFKYAGYMPDEVDGNERGEQVYGEFVQSMYDNLPFTPQWPHDVPRPLVMWGDMFDTGHNAARFQRRVNPYLPFLGLSRDPTWDQHLIPGIDADSRVTYIWWRVKPEVENNWQNWQTSIAFWADLTEGNQNIFDVVQGFNAGDYGTWTQDPERIDHFRGLLSMAFQNSDPPGGTSNFSGGLLHYWPEGDCEEERNADYDNYFPAYDAPIPANSTRSGEWLQWLWNFSPPTLPAPGFAQFYSRTEAEAVGAYKIFPLPNRPPTTEAAIDSVILQYRFGLGGSWSTTKLGKREDSLYTFALSLPDTGGVVEYRIWTFDSFGGFGSLPGVDTRWADPDAGQRYYFTFERRHTTPIDKPIKFYVPGILTQKHEIQAGGSITIEPLPGYRHSAMLVSDSAAIKFVPSQLTIMPRFTVAGTDTSEIVFELADSASGWGGIQRDSLGIVELNYVTFNTGETPIRFEKSPTDTMHVFDHAAFNSGLEIKGDVTIHGNAEATGVTVKNNGRLTIQPGSELSFADTARLVVEVGSKLTAVASDTNRIVFKAAVDSLGWLGIQFARGNNDKSALHYCDIQNADAGIMTDHTPVELAYCDITGCDVGILAINGAVLDVSNCTIEDGGDGVILTNLSLADIKDSGIGFNTGTGILALSRSTAYLKDSKVSENNGDGTAGGIGLYTGSEAFLKCTEVNGNTGPGIMAFNGVVMLSSVDSVSTSALTNWRGNSIFGNETVANEGQLSLRGRVGLGIYNGHDRIADSTSNNLVWWEDHPTRDWWRDVYWGSTDTSAILNRLPSNVLLSKIDSSWNLCHNFVGTPTSPDSLIRVFLNPHNYEVSGNYTSARTSYKQIVENSQASDYAFAASDRLLTTDMASGGSFATTRDYLVNRLKLTSNVALKTWMNNSIAWCWAELDSFARANQIYDSLANSTPTRLDRVSAHVQKHMVAVRQFSKDSLLHKPADVIARVDSARLAIERMNVWTQLTITDSVVVYAPATFEGSVSVKQPGQLWILPHPGSENPIVSFRGQGSVTVSGMNTQSPRSKFMVRGEADNIITLDWDSVGTIVWDNVSSSGGHVELKHATLRGRGFVSMNESSGQKAIFRADSCRFEGFDEGLWVWGVDSSSHIRNCTFTNVGADSDYTGTGFDAGVSVVEGSGFQIEDCEFENNEDMGIFAYFCGDLQVRNSVIRNNGEYGALVWDGGEVSFECSDFNSNGDTLAELWIENGAVDLIGGRNQFADSSGTLIYTAKPSYIDIADGENQLQLWNEDGYYLEVADTTTSSDITWNNWLPINPADSNFFDFLYPHNPAKWTVDSSLAEFIACGVAGGQSIGGGGNLIVLPSDGDGEAYSTPGSPDEAAMISFAGAATEKNGSDHSKATKGLTKSPSTIAKSAIPVNRLQKVVLHHQELASWREFKNLVKFATKQEGFEAGRSFVDAYPSSSLIPAALTRLSNLAKGDGSDLGISVYLESKSSTLPFESDRVVARRLACLAKAYEGKAAEGLAGLEALMESATSPQDSIRALVDAMGVFYFYNPSGKLQPRHPQVRNESLQSLGKRVRDLAKILENPSLAANDRTSLIPTEYHLYQNYPNPFNPVTEIAFDLPAAVWVELKVFNILGQEVATLMDAVRPAGVYRVLWDSKNTSGMTVASGVYVYQIQAGKFIDAKKMVLIR